MILFVKELHQSIQTAVTWFGEPKNQSKLSYEELNHYSEDESDSHRARPQYFAEVANGKVRKKENPVFCMELNRIDKQTNQHDNHLYSFDDDLKPFEKYRD